MATHYVQFRGTRADVSRVVNTAARILSGTEPDQDDLGKGFLYTLGFLALSDIKDAYIVKARGGTDEMGVKWPPLSPEYLAYGRRFSPGEQAGLKRAAGLGAKHRRAPGERKGLLSGAQLKQWRFLFRMFLVRFKLSEGEQSAKGHAAAVAWVIMKKRGAKTKLQVYGHREVDILRDIGVLLNSLSPGIMTTSGGRVSYGKPTGEGGEEQIFDAEPGAIIVGTNVAYASIHQNGGKGGKGPPQRVFLPDEQHPVPRAWWQRWVSGATQSLAITLAAFLRNNPGGTQ